MTGQPAHTSPSERAASARAPELPEGVRLRRGLLESDYAGLAELRTRSNAADGIEGVRTVQDIANEVAHRTGWDPADDVFLADSEGSGGARLVGWSLARAASAGTGERIFSIGGSVDPDHRRRGIGRAILRRAEARLRERAAQEVAAGRSDPTRIFMGWHPDKDPAARRLFESEGYRPIRFFFHMVRPELEGLDSPVVPEGLEVRPFRETDLDPIFAAEEEAFSQEWLEEEPQAEHRASYLGRPGVDPDLWQVAWQGSEVAGIVFPTDDPETDVRYGRHRVLLDAVAVRTPFRRRGVATALMLRALHAARERGATSADLWVDSENPSGALGIYRRLGFEVEQRTTAFSKPLED